ncbi:MAG: GNAT family N-acetyltransferase [Dongiaceae bacterium]
MEQVSLRQPDLADAALLPATPQASTERVADLIWTVDPKLCEFLFRGDVPTWRELLRTDWSQAVGLLSHSHSRIALVDNQIAGVIVGHDRESLHDHWTITLERWFESTGPVMRAHLPKSFYYLDLLLPKIPEDVFYVLELAVASEVQRNGIGTKLMNDAFERARDDGYQSLMLDVNAASPALDFYRRLGMDVLVETHVPYLSANHNVGLYLRLEKKLH